jgi:hypothetical protein
MTATATYDNHSRRRSNYSRPTRELSRRIARIPGVAHVALSATRPIYSISWINFYAATDSMTREFNPTYTVCRRDISRRVEFACSTEAISRTHARANML